MIAGPDKIAQIINTLPKNTIRKSAIEMLGHLYPFLQNELQQNILLGGVIALGADDDESVREAYSIALSKIFPYLPDKHRNQIIVKELLDRIGPGKQIASANFTDFSQLNDIERAKLLKRLMNMINSNEPNNLDVVAIQGSQVTFQYDDSKNVNNKAQISGNNKRKANENDSDDYVKKKQKLTNSQ